MGPCIAFINIVIVFLNTFWKVVETLCGTCLTHKNSWAEGHKSRSQPGKVDSCADCYFWINHWICDPFLSKEEGNGVKLPLMFFFAWDVWPFFQFSLLHMNIWVWNLTWHSASPFRTQESRLFSNQLWQNMIFFWVKTGESLPLGDGSSLTASATVSSSSSTLTPQHWWNYSHFR